MPLTVDSLALMNLRILSKVKEHIAVLYFGYNLKKKGDVSYITVVGGYRTRRFNFLFTGFNNLASNIHPLQNPAKMHNGLFRLAYSYCITSFLFVFIKLITLS